MRSVLIWDFKTATCCIDQRSPNYVVKADPHWCLHASAEMVGNTVPGRVPSVCYLHIANAVLSGVGPNASHVASDSFV